MVPSTSCCKEQTLGPTLNYPVATPPPQEPPPFFPPRKHAWAEASCRPLARSLQMPPSLTINWPFGSLSRWLHCEQTGPIKLRFALLTASILSRLWGHLRPLPRPGHSPHPSAPFPPQILHHPLALDKPLLLLTSVTGGHCSGDTFTYNKARGCCPHYTDENT